MFPPRANTLIARLLFPAAIRAARAASGWNAEIPSPATAMSTQVAQYSAEKATRLTPTAAVSIPVGMSHRRGRRSPHQPNAGCATDERRLAARTSPATAA